ncbi:hypothetical protein E2C01_094974 [Portunus trituberculatus]|uniref:Uncharacterized protein n=1 Tax=Portunus trituberculatus TaxID=210409 RepID=A0A5B7JYM2_PORTR|nr:hypothetical protein [Portunus trituberculatus]
MNVEEKAKGNSNNKPTLVREVTVNSAVSIESAISSPSQHIDHSLQNTPVPCSLETKILHNGIGKDSQRTSEK